MCNWPQALVSGNFCLYNNKVFIKRLQVAHFCYVLLAVSTYMCQQLSLQYYAVAEHTSLLPNRVRSEC